MLSCIKVFLLILTIWMRFQSSMRRSTRLKTLTLTSRETSWTTFISSCKTSTKINLSKAERTKSVYRGERIQTSNNQILDNKDSTCNMSPSYLIMRTSDSASLISILQLNAFMIKKLGTSHNKNKDFNLSRKSPCV